MRIASIPSLGMSYAPVAQYLQYLRSPYATVRLNRVLGEKVQLRHPAGAALGGGGCACAGLRAAGLSYQVAAHWNVDTSEETGVEGLPGPLGACVAAVQRALDDASRALRESGRPTLGALILKMLGDQAAEGAAPSAALLVEGLAEAVPGFGDEAECGGRRVTFYRKALAAQLHLRFRGNDPRFAFADADQLTVDLGERREQGGDAREVALRAGTVVGGQAVVDAAGGAFQAFHLSAYLAQQAERAAAEATAASEAGSETGAHGQQEAALAKGFVDSLPPPHPWPGHHMPRDCSWSPLLALACW
eukprot:scaffold12.g8272.t1